MDLQHTETTYAVTIKGVKICPYSDTILQIFTAILVLYFTGTFR
jgi:hypothetical protein